MVRAIVSILAVFVIVVTLSMLASDKGKLTPPKLEAIEVTVGDGTKATCFMSPYRGLFCIPHVFMEGVSND
jgi:hypothetical protein